MNVSCAERAGCVGDRLCYHLGDRIPNAGCFRWTLPETILDDCAAPLYVKIDCEHWLQTVRHPRESCAS